MSPLPIYYINLDRSTDRLYNISKQQAKLKTEFTRIKAVDGKLLTPQQKKENCSKFCQTFCTPSMIGCFLSHKLAWKTVVDNGDDWAVIIEDDCILHKNFIPHVKTVVSELNIKESNWDFVYLGSLSFNHASFIPSVKTKMKYKAFSYTVPVRPMGFHCYLISKQGANKLLSVFKKVEYHVDLMFLLNNHHFRVFSSKKVLGIQKTSCNSSTLNENKFPKVINGFIDTHGPKPDNVSLSYHFGAPIIKLPVINVNLNTYIIFIIILLLSSRYLMPYVYIYLLYELLIANTPDDQEFIAKWLLIFSSFLV
jgi:glycosyl transferase, family 25